MIAFSTIEHLKGLESDMNAIESGVKDVEEKLRMLELGAGWLLNAVVACNEVN